MIEPVLGYLALTFLAPVAATSRHDFFDLLPRLSARDRERGHEFDLGFRA